MSHQEPACWLNLDKKHPVLPAKSSLQFVAGGSLTPGLLASAANTWCGRPMNHGGTPKSSMDGFSLLSIRGTSIFRNPPSDGFSGTWNWWHQRIWWDLVNFGINHHYWAIIHHYYGDFTIIQPWSWMTTGRIFSPWGVHPNIDHRFRCTGNGSRREFQQEFLEFETGFFLTDCIWLHMIAYDGNVFFFMGTNLDAWGWHPQKMRWLLS